MTINYNFVDPRTPRYDKGVLVIESDDGYAGDYNAWLPLFQRLKNKHSQWVGSNTVVGNSAILTATIGQSDKMTVDNLRELVDNGWEMLSHGRYHVGLSELEITENAPIGSSKLTIKGAGQIRVESGYTYRLYEGNQEEIIKPILPKITSGTFNIETVNLESPLKNSYTSSARMQLTDASYEHLLQGCIDDLNSWGIDCKHHVFTYHAGSQHMYSQKSVDEVAKRFISGRGQSGATQVPMNAELVNLKCQLNTMSRTQIDTTLDDVATNDLLFIYYGHGELSLNILDDLEYLVDGALSRGIRIMTRTNALKHYGLMA